MITRVLPTGVVLAFKAVIREGMEVAFIIIAFGGSAATQGNGIGSAALGTTLVRELPGKK